MNNTKEYVVLLCGYAGANISGGDEHALQLISYLNNAGNIVKVILPADAYRERLNAEVERINIPNLPFESRFRGIKSLLLFCYLWRIAFAWFVLRRLSVSGAQIVVAASHLFHDVLPLSFQKKRGSIFVYAYHLINFCHTRKGVAAQISAFLERISIRAMAACNANIITSSSVVRTQLLSMLPQKIGDIFLSRNGVDLNILQAVPAQEKKIEIVFCGRFVEHKGVCDLLRAISYIPLERRGNVVLIGRGPDLNKILKLREELELNCVRIVTDADDFEKFRLMKSAKIFVLPSYEEGWGIVIGEALACGIKVIAYEIEEIHSIWGDSVIWIERGNIQKLATGIQGLMAHGEIGEADAEYWQSALSWEMILQAESCYFDSKQ